MKVIGWKILQEFLSQRWVLLNKNFLLGDASIFSPADMKMTDCSMHEVYNSQGNPSNPQKWACRSHDPPKFSICKLWPCETTPLVTFNYHKGKKNMQCILIFIRLIKTRNLSKRLHIFHINKCAYQKYIEKV